MRRSLPLRALSCIGLPVLVLQPSVPRSLAGAATPASPTVNVAAFDRQGKLAFRSGGNLYVLDGSDGALHRLGPIGNLAEIAWSADGNWLAYQTSDPASGIAGPLVVTHADGSAKHRIASLPSAPGQFQWSPTAGALAISVPGTKPFQSSIWLATPAGRPTKLVDGGSADSRVVA